MVRFGSQSSSGLFMMVLYTFAAYLAISAHMRIVKGYGSVVAVLVGNMRKAGTIYLSFIMFPKPFSWLYVVGSVFVLGGLSTVAYVKVKRQIFSPPLLLLLLRLSLFIFHAHYLSHALCFPSFLFFLFPIHAPISPSISPFLPFVCPPHLTHALGFAGQETKGQGRRSCCGGGISEPPKVRGRVSLGPLRIKPRAADHVLLITCCWSLSSEIGTAVLNLSIS